MGRGSGPSGLCRSAGILPVTGRRHPSGLLGILGLLEEGLGSLGFANRNRVRHH